MANPYVAFLALIPKQPVKIGTVTEVDGALYTIQMPGGQLVQAKSTTAYAVGTKVFFAAGVIQGTAPTLPVSEITVF